MSSWLLWVLQLPSSAMSLIEGCALQFPTITHAFTIQYIMDIQILINVNLLTPFNPFNS